MIRVRRKIIQSEIAHIPVEIRLRHIDRLRAHCATGARMDTERTRITEEIEDALTRCALLHGKSRRPVIEKKPDVEIVGEIDFEAEAMLAHDLDRAACIETLVLIAAAVFRALTPAVLDVQALARNVEPRENLRLGIDAIVALLLERVVLRPVEKPRNGVARCHCTWLACSLHTPGFVAVPIDDHRELGNVLLVESKTGNPLLTRPLGDVPHAVVESFTEHFVRVAESSHDRR